MKNLKSKEWWEAAGTRAVRTMAQTFIAVAGTAAILTEVDWVYVGSAVALSGILSLATSLSGLPEVNETKV
ncbi:MAG: holin [Coprobacillaceae bacterium]